MLGISSFGIREAALMFALGFGYIICYLAKKQDKGMQGLGHFIGMSIIILSTLLIVLNIYTRLSLKSYYRFIGNTLPCPAMKAGMMGQTPMPNPPRK